MEFQNLIEKRRSVRKYVERNTVTKDEILSMIKAAQEAPSWISCKIKTHVIKYKRGCGNLKKICGNCFSRISGNVCRK